MGSEGSSPAVVHRLLIAVASFVEESSFQSSGSIVMVHRVWGLPGSEMESVSPALAGGLLSHKGSS